MAVRLTASSCRRLTTSRSPAPSSNSSSPPPMTKLSTDPPVLASASVRLSAGVAPVWWM